MQRLGPSRFKIQAKSDWCHVCGQRRQILFVEVWRPLNAEHERNPGKHAQYVRVCCTCIETLARSASVNMEARPPQAMNTDPHRGVSAARRPCVTFRGSDSTQPSTAAQDALCGNVGRVRNAAASRR